MHRSLLSAAERRTLIWMAERLPGWIGSDHLTGLALAAMLAASAAYWLALAHPGLGLGLATLCLGVNWFGDSLDGTVARVRRHERPRYGYYVDHVVDIVGAVALIGGLALSGYMSSGIAFGLLIAYLAVSAEVYLAAHVVGRFHLSAFGVGPTELRLLLAAGNVAVWLHPTTTVFGRQLLLMDVGGLVGMAGLAIAFGASAVRHTLQLYREEPLPVTTRVRHDNTGSRVSCAVPGNGPSWS